MGSRFWIRVFALSRKELLHLTRDPRTLVLALVMPVVLLVLFGFGVSFDLDRFPLVVADEDQTPASRSLVLAFTSNGEFEAVGTAQSGNATEKLRTGDAIAVLVIPHGYSERLSRRQTSQVELLIDGSDASSANQVLQKADAVVRAQTSVLMGVKQLTPPLEVRSWTRYNPTSRSAVFIVPGLSAYLMALGAVLLTALTVAAEWERGSMEQLFASPVGRFEIILGKLLPYLVIGMLQLLLVIAFGATAFDVPIEGSVTLLFVFGAVFLVGMLGQGLLISVLSKNQLVATQAGTLSAMLPSLLFSGMLFPIENMPRPLQLMSNLIPARYLVHALRGIMLKGVGWNELWGDFVAMAIFSTAILVLATQRFRRRIA